MKYKGILIDLDDTVYDYERAHQKALARTLSEFCIIYKITLADAALMYEQAKRKVHIGLLGRASSHNRLIYFQTMIEFLEQSPFTYAMKLYNCYWDEFLSNMMMYEEVVEFIIRESKRGIKTCLLTDLTTHIQYRKVIKLGLEDYFTHIVTSEEAGVEKPHPHMFLCALDKMRMSKQDVIMIGDNYKKDILGAENIGLRSIWINHKRIDKPVASNIIEIRDLKKLRELCI